MATVPPPPSKRQKVAAESSRREAEEASQIPSGLGNVRVQFIDQASGHATGAPISIPLSQAKVRNLELLVNELVGVDGDRADKVPYRFAFRQDDKTNEDALDIVSDLYHSLIKTNLKSTEDLITLQYTPQAVFRVRAVSRCSASISGHAQPILAIQSSPATSGRFVSGSGDGTARIWDCDTGTPAHTLKGHTSWVLAVGYSPDGERVATGSYDNTVRTWTKEGKEIGGPLRGHKQWITSLAWEPYHMQVSGRPRVASASKDASVIIWDVVNGTRDMTLSRHTASVSCVKWGGTGNIYTASLDRTVKIWDSKNGTLIHNLTSHAHRVNYLALSTDFALRTSYHDHTGDIPATEEGKRAKSLERFTKASQTQSQTIERFATCSDDNKIYLWSSTDLKKPIRLDGHQKQVNHVAFSPDGHYVASCGFDNHVILWNAESGKFVKKLIGHVAAVYQCCFSADSRLLVSASKDTTIKAWDVRTGKMTEDLPGHKDEVFAVDWSADGKRVGSGGKDKMVRIWTS